MPPPRRPTTALYSRTKYHDIIPVTTNTRYLWPMSSVDNSKPWTFVTNHTQVLLCLAHNPDVRLRDVAHSVGITERAAQRILTDLVEAGLRPTPPGGQAQPLHHRPLPRHAPRRPIRSRDRPPHRPPRASGHRDARVTGAHPRRACTSSSWLASTRRSSTPEPATEWHTGSKNTGQTATTSPQCSSWASSHAPARLPARRQELAKCLTRPHKRGCKTSSCSRATIR